MHPTNYSTQSDAMWRHRPGSILAQVMACFLKAPGHSLPEAMLTYHQQDLVSFVGGNFARDTSAIKRINRDFLSKISVNLCMSQSVIFFFAICILLHVRVLDELLMLNFFPISGTSQEEVIQLFKSEIVGRKTQLVRITLNMLTHCGPVVPYDDKDLGHHWLM